MKDSQPTSVRGASPGVVGCFVIRLLTVRLLLPNVSFIGLATPLHFAQAASYNFGNSESAFSCVSRYMSEGHDPPAQYGPGWGCSNSSINPVGG